MFKAMSHYSLSTQIRISADGKIFPYFTSSFNLIFPIRKQWLFKVSLQSSQQNYKLILQRLSSLHRKLFKRKCKTQIVCLRWKQTRGAHIPLCVMKFILHNTSHFKATKKKYEVTK